LHRGHGKFVLVISAPELGLVLDVLEDRSKESLLKWLDERGIECCAAVKIACSDMWDAYQEAAEQKLVNARRVVDRFHVMKNLNEALTKARRAIQKDADEATKNLLKGCRWLLVKNISGFVQRKPVLQIENQNAQPTRVWLPQFQFPSFTRFGRF